MGGEPGRSQIQLCLAGPRLWGFPPGDDGAWDSRTCEFSIAFFSLKSLGSTFVQLIPDCGAVLLGMMGFATPGTARALERIQGEPVEFRGFGAKCPPPLQPFRSFPFPKDPQLIFACDSFLLGMMGFGTPGRPWGFGGIQGALESQGRRLTHQEGRHDVTWVPSRLFLNVHLLKGHSSSHKMKDKTKDKKETKVKDYM